MRFALYILPLVLVLVLSSFSAQAKLYKWVDEEGQMHFGDKVPEKYLVREYDELNDSGVVIRHKAAAETAEQKAEARRLEYERQKAALIEKKKIQRDRVLLDTYTTKRDLILARDSRLEAVDSQIQLANTIIADSNKKIESMEQQVIDIKASNREVPLYLYNQIDNEKEQVKVQSKVKKDYEKRRDQIDLQFNGYLQRFEVLKAEQKARREKIARERGF